MGSLLWPLVLVILLSFIIDSVDGGVNRNASHLVAKEVQNGSIPTSSQEYNTQEENSRDRKEKITSNHEVATLKGKHKRSAKGPALYDALLRTIDIPTNTTADDISTNDTVEDMPTYDSVEDMPTYDTVEDMPTYDSVEDMPTYDTVEDMPTNDSVEDMPTYDTVEDMPTNDSVEDMPTYDTVEDTPTNDTEQKITTAEDMPTSTTKQYITTVTIDKDEPTNTIEKDMSVRVSKEDMPINKTEEDMPTNTSKIYTPANTTEELVAISTNEEDLQTTMATSTPEEHVPTESPIAIQDVVFARSGDPIAHDTPCTKKVMPTCPHVKEQKQTSTPTVQVTVENRESSNEKECKCVKTCDRKKDIDVPSRCHSAPTCCAETMQKVHGAYKKTLTSFKARLVKLEKNTKSIFERLFAIDCSDVTHGKSKSGPKTLYLEQGGRRPVCVLCDMETDGGGWTVVQRRDPKSTPVAFERSWHDYKIGFGNPKTEYWVGLQNLYVWTNTRQYELRIEMTDYDGRTAYAHYRRFYLDDEDQGYRLHVSDYRGTAGDALTNKNTPDNFTADGMMFTTYDRDHDMAKNVNCAVLWKSGGWWYNSCSWSNLNGPHWRDADGCGVGINWHTWRNKEYLRTSTMMIRPAKYP